MTATAECAIAVKERPILFSGPMVRAILEGRKTQTRRVVKPQPVMDVTLDDHDYLGGWVIRTKGCTTAVASFNLGGYGGICPYGTPGDRLWVRESGWLDKD